jgi:hypothetical protein
MISTRSKTSRVRSELRALRYRDHPRVVDENVCGLRGYGEQEPRVERDLRDVAPRVERNGDVSYRWRSDAAEAFRDRGQWIASTDTSDAGIEARLDLARAKWGMTVELTGPDNYKVRALRLAVARGMFVSNVELQDLQRQVVEELERAQEPIRFDVVRILNHDPHGRGDERLAVKRWDEPTRTWSRQDSPPISGHLEMGQVHVVRVFADGRRDVDVESTEKLRVNMMKKQESARTRLRVHGIGRSGMSS